MLDLLLTLDRQLLFFVNHFPHNLFTNNLFLFFSIVGSFGFIWFFLAVLLFLFDGLDNRKEMIALFISGLLIFILIELFLKNIFIRVRPETAIEAEVLLILARSKSYSFPSGHATIAFASAYILSRQRSKLRWILYLFAFLIALSRVYLGVHYPSDIFAGGLIGLIIGYLSYDVLLKNLNFNLKKSKLKNEKYQ